MDTSERLQQANAQLAEREAIEEQATAALEAARERVRREEADRDAITAKMNQTDPDAEGDAFARFAAARSASADRVAALTARAKEAEKAHATAKGLADAAREEVQRAELAEVEEQLRGQEQTLIEALRADDARWQRQLAAHRALAARRDRLHRAAGAGRYGRPTRFSSLDPEARPGAALAQLGELLRRYEEEQLDLARQRRAG